MLGPNLCSFLFKLLHRILPTAERVARILPNQSPNCSRCREGVAETTQHALFDCPENRGAGGVLLNGLKTYIPSLSPIKIITLDYEIEEDLQFPIVWATATFLSTLWQLRVEKKRVELIKIRSEMESMCRLLRESRLIKSTEVLSKIF